MIFENIQDILDDITSMFIDIEDSNIRVVGSINSNNDVVIKFQKYNDSSDYVNLDLVLERLKDVSTQIDWEVTNISVYSRNYIDTCINLKFFSGKPVANITNFSYIFLKEFRENQDDARRAGFTACAPLKTLFDNQDAFKNDYHLIVISFYEKKQVSKSVNKSIFKRIFGI